ncbi:hypothetical protein K8S19_10220 [bacterium]|nr:hypothetical protein [bacterium]
MKKAVLVFIFSCFLTSSALAGLDLSGTVRNDAVWFFQDSDAVFVNLLENRLRFMRKTPDWKFYSDLKVDVMYSDQLAAEFGMPAGTDMVTADLLRAFIKVYSEYGDITVGKTYVNFGIPGVFNSFELDQKLNISDLNATKSGILAVAYDFDFSDMTIGKLYVSPEASEGSVLAGGMLSTNIGSFDMGMVMNRLGWDDNVAGLFLQGDLELGVQGSWAIHLDDDGQYQYFETTLGLDYSFFDGKVTAAIQGCVSDNWIRIPGTMFTYGSILVGSFDPLENAHLYANLTYAPDEFIQWRIDGFFHNYDASGLVIPSVQTVVADGLTLSVQCIFPTGTSDSVYGHEAYGNAIALVRLEAKL